MSGRFGRRPLALDASVSDWASRLEPAFGEPGFDRLIQELEADKSVGPKEMIELATKFMGRRTSRPEAIKALKKRHSEDMFDNARRRAVKRAN